MTDTGCSCITGPPRYIDYITEKILEATTNPVKNIDWRYTFDCQDTSRLHSFDILFGGYWFQVNVEDYVIDVDGRG